MIIKGLLCLYWLIIIPIILGKFLVKKDENELLYSWIMGNILQMGIFFVCAIPLILLKKSFMTLLYIYTVIIVILTFISILVNRHKFKLNIKKRKITVFQVIAIILIFVQLFMKFEYANINNDDASFVSISTTMIQTNKMYLHSTTGAETNIIESRRALAPISAYYAVLSKLVCTHVTILTHTVLPILFISMLYGIYYYLAKKIFKEKDSIYIFLIIICFLNLFSFSIKGANRYMILYSWFGRAILAMVILPLIWKICFDAMNKESNEIMDWIKMFFTVLAGCLGTEMANALIPISLGAMAIVSSIRDKEISYLFKTLICIIPCILIGIIYLIIK